MNELIAYSIFSILCLFIFDLGYSQQTKIYNGTTVIEQVHSPALEGNLQGNPATQSVKVYLPPRYHLFPGNAYPVVYLLHGNHQDYNAFSNYDLYNKLNRLISENKIKPMIIITPNAKTIYGGSHYANSYVSGYWEDYIVQDVIGNCEDKYLIIDKQKSRGMAGFSMGASGAVKIAMRHASLLNSIGLIGGGSLDFEERHFVLQMDVDDMIEAARKNEYSSSDRYGVKTCYSKAVAYAPDSSNNPVMGRLPVDADGLRIDSIWQKWLEHDPKTMLSTYKDSLMKLNAIQLYIGDSDERFGASESFHQALIDHGIEHGNEIYTGGHDPTPVLDDLLIFFSENLHGVVPTIRSSSDYFLENSDTLMAESDKDGKLYIVPLTAGIGLDSIYTYQVETADALANEESEFQLSGLEFGRYRVFAVTSDSIVSNIPEEFCIVPDKSLPLIDLESDIVVKGDSILVSNTRDGMLYLVYKGTLPYQIKESFYFIDSITAYANVQIKIPTSGLIENNSYWLYAVDNYGIFSEPKTVSIDSPSRVIENTNKGLSIYPNPTKDLLTIETGIVGKHIIEITSLNGQLINSIEMVGSSHQLDLSSLQKGAYFITIRSKDFVTTEKIIKY